MTPMSEDTPLLTAEQRLRLQADTAAAYGFIIGLEMAAAFHDKLVANHQAQAVDPTISEDLRSTYLRHAKWHTMSAAAIRDLIDPGLRSHPPARTNAAGGRP